MATLVTVTFWTDTGVVEDQVVNDFAIGSDLTGVVDSGGGAQPNAAAMDALTTAIAAFYNTPPAAQPINVGNYLSSIFDNAANRATVRFYNINAAMNGQPHGSPIGMRNFTLAAGSVAAPLPSEVAYVATLEALGRSAAQVEVPDGADPGALVDRPKQRRTGRLYLGPLNTDATAVVSGVVRPSTGFRDVVLDAVEDLWVDVNAVLGDFFLGVWSRVDGLVRGLEAVSADNSFDTQRRRGEAPTLRTRQAIP